MTKQQLQARWVNLWTPFGVDVRLCLSTFDQVYGAYADPARGYHGVPHLSHGLNLVTEIAHLADCPQSLEASWWTHDFFSDLYRRDNERRSKDFALRKFGMFNVSSVFLHNVDGNVMATGHKLLNMSRDQQLICDIDLWSFAAETWIEVCKKTWGILHEAPHTPVAQFIANRRGVLGGFLKRERIYHTQYFFERYENRARENIMQEIEQLPEILREIPML